MDKPEIESFFTKQKTTIRNNIAFLGVGAGALLFNQYVNWVTPIVIGAIVPMIIDLKETKNLVDNKPYPNGSRFTFFLNKSLGKWLNKYINGSDNLIEKKYKVLFLHLWAEHKETSIDDIVYSNPDLFKELSHSLIKEGLTKYNLFEMLIDSSKSVDLNGDRVVVKDFFAEDLNNPERVAIAKKVFEEYKDIGLIGKSFLRRSNYDALLYLQHNKFSNMDYGVIKKYTEDLENGEYHESVNYAPSSINFSRYPDVVKETMEILVNNESNLNNLQILKKYYDTMIELYKLCRLGIDTPVQELEKIQDFIENKIEYLELGNELDTQKYSSKAAKRSKI
jgi:hypothetical protein